LRCVPTKRVAVYYDETLVDGTTAINALAHGAAGFQLRGRGGRHEGSSGRRLSFVNESVAIAVMSSPILLFFTAVGLDLETAFLGCLFLLLAALLSGGLVPPCRGLTGAENGLIAAF
jgi:hypothetical protein